MLEIGLSHYLVLAAILFTLGVFGIFLNRKNVINVYRRTGTADEDGFLTNPDLSEKIVEARGEEFVDMFEKINLQNREHYWANQGGDLYDQPRQVHLGLSLDF